MGIRFGSYTFSEPQPLPAGDPQLLLRGTGGLYVVLAPDSSAQPKPYRPLYFGESGCIRSRATSGHEKYQSWCASAGLFAPLFVAYCALPGFTKTQRQMAETDLITHYTPPCNERVSVSWP